MRKLIMIVLCVLLVATSFVVGCNGSVGLAAPTQEIGHHSTWSTNSGAIRDDYLADYVCNAIPKDDDGVPLVKDVVIMMNSCFSGGFAREFQDVFGIWERTGTKCWGVPWIFASACAADEEAWGYRNGSATELGLGTYWTNALAFQYSWAYVPVDEDGKPIIPEIELGPPGSIRDSNTHNVLADFESARELDWANPEHPYNAECGRREHGVIAYNNGGENIVWNAADTKHEALVFGGNANKDRHDNNVHNVETALSLVWAGSISYNIEKIADGTQQDFLNAIDLACGRLNSDTQLVLYFDDHGGSTVDDDEKKGWQELRIDPPPHDVEGFEAGESAPKLTNRVVEYYGKANKVRAIMDAGTETVAWGDNIAVPAFWEESFDSMIRQGEQPEPSITLGLVEPILPEEWVISFNDVPLVWPVLPMSLTGEVQLAVNWTTIHAGNNTLEIYAVGEPSGPMVLDNLELYTGPINDGDWAMLYNLITSSTAGGVVTTPGEGMFSYQEETVVGLVASPDAGYRFDEWSGDVDTVSDVNAATTNITINRDHSITANFVAICDLTISSTAGGSVIIPGEGTFTYDCGTVVDLMAIPDAGYHFVNWTGDVDTIADVNAATTTITVNGDYSIAANFGTT